MQIATYLAQLTGFPSSTLFAPANPLARISSTGGVFSVDYWNVPGVAQPTPAQLAAAVAAAEPAVVPASVTRAQFFHAAAQGGIITNAEAIAVFTGVVPASLSTAIATLSASQQFAAKIAILGNTTFERANPILIALGAAMGQTPAQIDALFTLAASL